MSFFSGYKPSPHVASDKPFDLVKPALVGLAESAAGQEHVIAEHTPISDQLTLNSCVANAVCDLLEVVIGLEDPSKVVQLSRLHLYWDARSYTRDTGKDEGTFIRNAIDSLRTLGVCREDVWPYVPANVFAQPPIRAYKESLDNKISAYYRVLGTGGARLDGVEAAIRANHPVTVAAPVDNTFVAYRGGGKVFDAPSSWVGFHAMIIVGVRVNNRGEREFLLRNSWGPYWGDGGRVWVSSGFLGSTNVDDCWVITRAPSLVF